VKPTERRPNRRVMQSIVKVDSGYRYQQYYQINNLITLIMFCLFTIIVDCNKHYPHIKGEYYVEKINDLNETKPTIHSGPHASCFGASERRYIRAVEVEIRCYNIAGNRHQQQHCRPTRSSQSIQLRTLWPVQLRIWYCE